MKDNCDKESDIKKAIKGPILDRDIGEGFLSSLERAHHTQEELINRLNRLCAYEYAERFAADNLVLDLGCGNGFGTYKLSTKACGTVGIDISRKAIRSCHLEYGSERPFLAASGNYLPFKDDLFDLVVSFQVIEHIQPNTVFNYLKEIKRVLKSGGLLVASTPNKRLRLLPFQKPWNPDHKTEYDAKQLERLLRVIFTKVEISGLFAAKDAYMIEYERVKQNPLFIYLLNPLFSVANRLFPSCLAIMFRRALAGRRKIDEKSKNGGIIDPKFSTTDFQTSEENLEACIDIYGICTK